MVVHQLNIVSTRMHSSRMRTVCCRGRLILGGGGVCPGSVCQGGVHLPPLWTEFLTHTCENITFPQLRLRTVKNHVLVLVKVCLHLTFAFAFASTSPSKFNIASMETQTQMHRMGLNPFLTFYIDVGANANANVKCEHNLKNHKLKCVHSL